MKRVRINQIKVGDIISYDDRFWFVEAVSSHLEVCGTRFIVKVHDLDDIFYTRYLTNNCRFYTVM